MSVHDDEDESPDFPEDFGDLVMVDEIGSDDDDTSAQEPTDSSVKAPNDSPTKAPTEAPIKAPIDSPIKVLTDQPIKVPTDDPIKAPTDAPIKALTDAPIKVPTDQPIKAPTDVQIKTPTDVQIKAPTDTPIKAPTDMLIKAPTEAPVKAPTDQPIKAPTDQPIKAPSDAPIKAQIDQPIKAPTDQVVVRIKKEPNETVAKSSDDQVVVTIKKKTQDHANIIKSVTSEKPGSGQQSQKDLGKSQAIKTVPSLSMPRKKGKRIRPGQRQRREAAQAAEAAAKLKPQIIENKITLVESSIKKADPKFGNFPKKRFQESSAGRRARRLRQTARAIAAAANRPNFGPGFPSRDLRQNFARQSFGPNDPFQINRGDMMMGPMNFNAQHPDNNPQNRGFFREGLDFGQRQNDFMNEPYNTRFENTDMRREGLNFHHDEEEFLRRRHDVMYNEERERIRGGYDEQQDFMKRSFDIDDVECRQLMREHANFSMGRPNEMHHRHMEMMKQGPNFEQDHRDFHMGRSEYAEKGNRQGFGVGPVLLEDDEVIPNRDLANLRNDQIDFRKDFSSMEDDRLFKAFGFDRHDMSFGHERGMISREDDFERDKFVKDTFRGRNIKEDFPSREFDRMDKEKRNKFVKDTLRGRNVTEDHPSQEFDWRDDSKRDRFVKDTLRGKNVMEDFPSREYNWRDEEERNRRIDYPERDDSNAGKGIPFHHVQGKLEKCPIPGCFIECNDLYYHASQKHIPGIFKTVENSDKISQANVTPTRVAALRALKMAILGPQGSFNALMDLVNGIGIDVPKNEELASCHWAMVEVCRDQDWKEPDRFSLNPINSPAGLIHWRPLLILISLLDEKRRMSILSAFPPAGKFSSMDHLTSDFFQNSSNKSKEILKSEAFTIYSSQSKPKNSNHNVRNMQAKRTSLSENSENSLFQRTDNLQNTYNQRSNPSDTQFKRRRNRVRNRNRHRGGKPSSNVNNGSHDNRADSLGSYSQGNPEANYQMGPRDSRTMSISTSSQARDRKIRSLFDSEIQYSRSGNTLQNRNLEMMNSLQLDQTSTSQNFQQMRSQRGTYNEEFPTENVIRQQGLGFTESVPVRSMGLSSLTRQMDRSFEGSLGQNTGNIGINYSDGMQWGQGLDYQFQGNIPNQQMQMWSGTGNSRQFPGH